MNSISAPVGWRAMAMSAPAPVSAPIDSLLDILGPAARQIAAQGRVCRYKKNAVILTEGHPADSMFFLLAGRARAYSDGASNREITYWHFGPGDFFGEASLVGQWQTASVAALEACVCSVVSRASLSGILETQPELALEILAGVIHRSRELALMARDLALLDVYERLVRALERAAGGEHGELPVTLKPITQRMIATQIGASREMVSRLLRDLQRGGYILLGDREVTVKRKLPPKW